MMEVFILQIRLEDGWYNGAASLDCEEIKSWLAIILESNTCPELKLGSPILNTRYRIQALAVDMDFNRPVAPRYIPLPS